MEYNELTAESKLLPRAELNIVKWSRQFRVITTDDRLLFGFRNGLINRIEQLEQSELLL